MKTTLRPYALSAIVGLSLIVCACQSRRSDLASELDFTMTHQHHTIDYIEFTVSDMAAAQQFYAQAFGWTFTDYGPDYAGIQKSDGDGEVGGLRSDATVTRGGPLVVLYSTDIEASVQAVEQAGGSIVQEPFAFPGGRRFHFLDPSGNELAVWGQ